MRVFLDANVLFSAAKSDGAVRELLRRLQAAGHVLVADAYVAGEARRNLASKGASALDDLEALLSGVVDVVAMVVTPPRAASIDRVAATDLSWLPAKDQPVLAAAIRHRCEVLVTGDRAHFGAAYGQSFGGVTVHSPRSLFDTL